MTRNKHTILLYLLLSLLVGTCYAQVSDSVAYYQSYDNQITGRLFFSRKFTNLRLRGENYSLLYRPNTGTNLGVGFTHEWITLNFGYGFGFLNPNRLEAKTRSIDLQFHPYGRKIAIDVLGQFYRGFRLPSSNDDLRNDIRVNVMGATAQYIFNHEQFSYRAAFLQSEWQKRSAGTWLAGFEMYTGNVRGDSTLVPDEKRKESRLQSVRFFELGPNVGYAYTLVYKEHFFITGSGSVSLDLGFNKSVTEAETNRSSGISPNTLFKVFAGYNSARWAITGVYISNGVRLSLSEAENRVLLNTGNLRLHFAYRFKPGKRLKDLLKRVDKTAEQK